jgi:hypothetical protein
VVDEIVQIGAWNSFKERVALTCISTLGVVRDSCVELPYTMLVI